MSDQRKALVGSTILQSHNMDGCDFVESGAGNNLYGPKRQFGMAQSREANCWAFDLTAVTKVKHDLYSKCLFFEQKK
jgi:hypothetical protein